MSAGNSTGAGRPGGPVGCSPRRWRAAAAGVLLGGVASVALGLVMIPELPPLLAGWALRAETLAWLTRHGLVGLRPALIGLFFGLAVGLPSLGVWAVARAPRHAAPPLTTSDRRAWSPGRLILLTTAAALLLQLASPPRWSSDAFLFAYYGKIQAVHHGNPYALPGRAFARTCALPQAPHRVATPGRPCRRDAHCPPPSRCLVDPFVPYQSWLEVRAAYGPVALGLFRAAYIEALPPAANVLLWRLWMAVAFWLLVAWVLRLRGPRAAALVGWLPLGVIVSANGGHLEALIGVALVGLLTAASAAGGWAVLGTGLCAGLLASIKLPLGALALPALLVVGRRRGGGIAPQVVAALLAALLAAALLAVGYGLLWASPHPFGGLADVGDTSIRTPLDLIRRLIQAAGGAGALTAWRAGFLGLWLWIVAQSLWRLGRTPLVEGVAAQPNAALIAPGLAGATLVVWLATTALASGIYHPWYALPGLVLASLSTTGPRRATVWLAVASPLLINGAWLVAGAAAFTLPWVAALVVLLWGGVLIFAYPHRLSSPLGD